MNAPRRRITVVSLDQAIRRLPPRRLASSSDPSIGLRLLSADGPK